MYHDMIRATQIFFQYSVGDALKALFEGFDGYSSAFNTPLEMPAGRRTGSGAATFTSFQYSVGDAGGAGGPTTAKS